MGFCKTNYNPRTRTIHHYEIICDSEESAREWHNRVIQAGYGGDPKIKDSVPEQKKILVLLNPFGGRGLAATKFEQAKQLLDLCHIDITLKHTERRNHAFDIAKELPIGEYNGIMTVSGDGLIHETINGIMARPDKEEMLKTIALGFIPAGTANALHKSVTDHFDEDIGIHSAAFATAKGRVTKIDLTECELEYM